MTIEINEREKIQQSKKLIDMWIWGESPLGEEFDDSQYIDFSLKTKDSHQIRDDMDELLKQWLNNPENINLPFLLQIKGVVGSGKTTTVKYFRDIINHADIQLFEKGFDDRIFHFPIDISENRVQFRKKGFLAHCISQLIDILLEKLPNYLKKLFSQYNKQYFFDHNFDYWDILDELENFLFSVGGIDQPTKIAEIIYYLGINNYNKTTTIDTLKTKIEKIKEYYSSSELLIEFWEKIFTFFIAFRETVEIPILIFSIDNWDLIEAYFFTEVYDAFDWLYNYCLRNKIPFSLIMSASDEFYNSISEKIDGNNKLFNHFLYDDKYKDEFLVNYRNLIILPDKLIKQHKHDIEFAIESIFQNFQIYKPNISDDIINSYKEIVKKNTENIFGSIKINELFSIVSNLLLEAIEHEQLVNLFEIDFKVYMNFLKIRSRRKVNLIKEENLWKGLIKYYEINNFEIISTIENEIIIENINGEKKKILFLKKLSSEHFEVIQRNEKRFLENFHLIVRNQGEKISQKINISNAFKRKIFLNGLPPLQITKLNAEQEVMLDLLPELDAIINETGNLKLVNRYKKFVNNYVHL